jgi:membrane fusion protein (multidrug efflux system)
MTEQLEQTDTHAPAGPQSMPDRPAHEAPPRPKRHIARWFLLLAALGIGAGATLYWLDSQHYEDTDDAQVDGHFDAVSSHITGTVTYINPKAENDQFIEAGTLLVELDPRDYQAELEHAQATFDTRRAESHSAEVMVPIVNASAFSQLRGSEAAKDQALASVNEAQSNLTAAQHRLEQDLAQSARAERDRVRYLALMEKREISRSEYDARETEALADAQAVAADRAAIESSQQKVEEARSLVAQRDAQIAAARSAPQQLTDAQDKSHSANGRVEEATADVHTAQLNLSYTKIYAPVSGVVGRKTVEPGHRIQPGQALMILVPLDDIWITANFKETQLKGMKPGEPVRIHVDTLGRDFNGYVENMAGAAGPLFSLFPPENATGNYVKVVQRFPVRLRLNANEDREHILRPGMSVEPRVKVR